MLSVSAEPLASGLSREQLQELYAALVLARATEDRLELLHKQGHIGGGVYRSLGEEACSVGSAYALRRRDDGTGDLLGCSVRTSGAIFLFGGTPLDYFRQYMSRGTGPSRGKEANVHWCDYPKGQLGPVSPLGTSVGVVAGMLLASKMRGEDRVGIVFYGEGATSTGMWHESVNFAAVQRCPLIVVVQQNQWAFSTPNWKTSRVRSFADKAPGYGAAGESVDGNDVVAVYEATKRAADRGRAGEGVTILELVTYRRRGHAQHDAQDYVDPEELRLWEGRDPISRHRMRLLENGWASEEELAAIEKDAAERVAAAADQAVSEPPPDPASALENVYTDVPTRAPWTRAGQPHPHSA